MKQRGWLNKPHEKKKKRIHFTEKVLSIRLLFGIIKSPNLTHRKRGNYTTMRDKSQVVLPIDLGICIDKEDFVFTLEEICESLNYDKLFEK